MRKAPTKMMVPTYFRISFAVPSLPIYEDRGRYQAYQAYQAKLAVPGVPSILLASVVMDVSAALFALP